MNQQSSGFPSAGGPLPPPQTVTLGGSETSGDVDDVVLSSPYSPIVRDLMKRILKTSALLKSAKEKVESINNNSRENGTSADTEAASGIPNDEEKALDHEGARIRSLLELYLFLWARLLKVLFEEHERFGEKYSSSLDLQDRTAFESLTYTVHRNTTFCDLLGQVLDVALERRPFDDEALSDKQRSILRNYFQKMEKVQLNASLCAVLIVEGSRESFLDPMAVEDLCKTIMEENERRKRLVPLSLAFSMLAQDEEAVVDLVSQGVDRVILQRFRHLTHRLYGAPPGGDIYASRQRRSPQRAIAGDRGDPLSRRTSPHRGSPHRSRRASPVPLERSSIPIMRPLPLVQEQALPEQGSAPPSPLPLPPAVRSFPADAQIPPTSAPSDEMGRKRAGNRDGVSPVLSRKHPRIENTDRLCVFSAQQWVPSIGERVARGIGWREGNQGSHCDYGEVVGFTGRGTVAVHWKKSEDAKTTKYTEDRLFRYSYGRPLLEIVPWDDYVQAQTKSSDKDGLRTVEFMLTAALTGVLCQRPDTVLSSFQFQTLESALHILDCVDLKEAKEAAEEAKQSALEEEERRFGISTDETQPAIQKCIEWNTHVQRTVQRNRDQHDAVARVLWILNGTLTHKKLCMRFLELSGLVRIQKLIDDDVDCASTVLGCVVVLTHLAKHSVFEELLRSHCAFFVPLMNFVLSQWEASSHPDIRTRAGSFLHYTLSFPYTLQYFDSRNGATVLLESLDTNVKASEEHFDVINPSVQLVALKCLNVYITSHLMLSTKVIFRKHRELSSLITNASPYTSLPRDTGTVESVLGFLWFPSEAIPDVSAENVASLLTKERLGCVQKLMDAGFHHLLLRCVNFYFIQSRWELLLTTLQGLCVLTVVPYIRQMIAEPRPNESGIPLLFVIVNDLVSSHVNGSASRENHLVPCVLSALQILLQMTTPPTDVKDDAQVAAFNRICSDLRSFDGVRILMELLLIKKDSSLSAKIHFFPVVARAVHLMALLKAFGDTSQLFEALGVHRVAHSLLQDFGPVQREYISMMGQRKLLTELDPAVRFMENVKWLMPQAFGESYQSDAVRAPPTDPVELEMRRAIVAHASIDYTQDSLLSLIADHLESKGLLSTAESLRGEAHLGQRHASVLSANEASPPSEPSITLDSVVRSYLRQQQERSPNPIETLPQFDLTKKHVYVPPPPSADPCRSTFNRLLALKMNERSLKYAINESCFVYRNPAFIFDIMSEGDLQGDSICFCDNGDALVTGTSDGLLYIFDTFPEETMEKLIEQHIVFENEGITSLVASPDGSLLCAVNERNDTKIMPRASLPVTRCELTNCRAARFSHDNGTLLVTSGEEHVARLIDLRSQQELRQFSDRVWSGDNVDNVAQFDATSSLVLHDAVLWDVRCNNRPIYRFDRITESFASAFHPSNQKVMIDEKVWDLRAFQIVHTVPVFQKASSFHWNPIGKVIYGFRESSSAAPASGAILSAVDSYSFEVVFSEEVQPAFRSFALDPSDRYCAAILDENRGSPVRIFSTASGPYPDRRKFAAPGLHQDAEENEDGAEDEEEDEIGNWSTSDDLDFDDDEEIESSATYSGEESEDEDDDDEDGRTPEVGSQTEDSESENTSAGLPLGSADEDDEYDDQGLLEDEEDNGEESEEGEESSVFEHADSRDGSSQDSSSLQDTMSTHST